MIKERRKRQNHKSTVALLPVPKHTNLLEDQDDEDESARGRALVTSSVGWRVVLAKFISDAWEADRLTQESEDYDETADLALRDLPPVPKKWTSLTLAECFGGLPKKAVRSPQTQVISIALTPITYRSHLADRCLTVGGVS